MLSVSISLRLLRCHLVQRTGKMVLISSPRLLPGGQTPVSSRLATWFKDDEVTEDFVRGWGPGGQAVNTTSNCVVLRHRPTGIVVKCQDTRDFNVNRKIARQRLDDKLDEYYNGEDSAAAQAKRKADKREWQKYTRSKRRLAEKLAFKQREGLTQQSPLDANSVPPSEQ